MPLRLSFDRVASIYDETRGLSPKVLSHVLGILVDQLQGKKALEVGVGTGRYAVPLQKSGIQVVGVDISQKMVEHGLRKGLHDVVLADGARLPFVARTFDMTTTNHTLHLVPDWRDVLLEIARVTRDSYFSIIEKAEEKSTLQAEYHDLSRAAGFDWEHPGLHERDLPALLPPDMIMPVGPFDELLPADRLLDELENRAYSSQWTVPESIHRQAMHTLRERWGGHDIHHRYTLEITWWRAERLAGLAKVPVQRS
jgi:SAM-dependent methyltransferase